MKEKKRVNCSNLAGNFKSKPKHGNKSVQLQFRRCTITQFSSKKCKTRSNTLKNGYLVYQIHSHSFESGILESLAPFVHGKLIQVGDEFLFMDETGKCLHNFFISRYCHKRYLDRLPIFEVRSILLLKVGVLR